MFLLDFQEAIDILAKALGGKCTCCFQNIGVNVFGDKFIFTIDENSFYVVNLKTGRITKQFNDTWRNPEHIEIIKWG